jgi:class 3 adenylate cyclase
VDGLQTTAGIVPHVTAGSHSLVTVVIRQPGRVPLRLLLGGPAMEVGRDCRGLLLTDPRISRRHLSLQEAAGTVRVTDLGSTNGTLVDGAPLHGTHVLAPGEVVQLGASTIVLSPDSPDSPDSPHGRATADADRPMTSIELVAAASVVDPPDFAALPADAGTLTLVFSDIEGSTRRAVELGVDRWDAVLEMHHAVVRRHVDRIGGSELKSHGDGFMLSFPNARRALSCMVDVQRALHALARSRPADAVRVRVGVHTGEVIVDDDGDLFGRPAAIAWRVAEAARGGEILASGIVRELVEPSGDVEFGPARMVTLRGFRREHLVHPVPWAP